MLQAHHVKVFWFAYFRRVTGINILTVVFSTPKKKNLPVVFSKKKKNLIVVWNLLFPCYLSRVNIVELIG